MRRLSLGLALLAVLLSASTAHANLILLKADGTAAPTIAESFVDIGGNGFGNAPRLLTLQTNGRESGFETPIDVENGDAIDGANKSTTPTLTSLGWTAGSQVGIGFNSGQTGGSGVTLQSLVLTIFNGAAVVGTFSLAAPLQFTEADLGLQQGNGNAVFNFGLDAAQRTQFNTLLALAGSGNFRAGVGATLGCAAGAPASCQPSNDGPDSFLGFVQSGSVKQVVPEPATMLLFSTGLLAGVRRFRRK